MSVTRNYIEENSSADAVLSNFKNMIDNIEYKWDHLYDNLNNFRNSVEEQNKRFQIKKDVEKATSSLKTHLYHFGGITLGISGVLAAMAYIRKKKREKERNTNQ